MFAGDEAASDHVLTLLDQTVEVRLGRDCEDPTTQVLATTFVELAARLFPRIHIECPASTDVHPSLPPGEAKLASRLEEIRHHVIEPRSTQDATLVVGIGDVDGADFHLAARGWSSYVGTRPHAFASRPANEQNPFGALLGAARGAAAITKMLLGHKTADSASLPTAYNNALTHEFGATSSDEVDEPLPRGVEALLAGAGSLGGAVVFALSHVQGLQGSLKVVDPQQFEDHNAVRSILCTAEQAIARESKATVAERALKGSLGDEVSIHIGTFQDYICSLPQGNPLPLVVATTDSVASRREIQECTPFQTISAACNATEATVSGHVTDDGPCPYCLLLPQVRNSENIRIRRIADLMETSPREIALRWARLVPLNPTDTSKIERQMKLNPGSLDRWVGSTVNEFYEGFLRYAEIPVGASGTRASVPAAFVSALAGFLAAAELLKWSEPTLRRYRLGPHGEVGVLYRENAFHPDAPLIRTPRRCEDSFCLCRSTRRLRLMKERYSLL